MPLREWLKVQAMLPKLVEMKKTINELQKKMEALNTTIQHEE
jgi:hypothetical protein